MSSLPDHILLQDLEIGTATRRLDHRALCLLPMVNSKFNQLSNNPRLWTTLDSQEFPQSHYQYSEAPPKSLYQEKFEEEKFASFEAQCSPRHLSGYTREFHDISSFIPPNPPSPSASPLNLSEQDFIIDQRTSHLEHKFKRSCNKGPKPKGVPYSRHYVPLNMPPRQAMPRKN